MLFSNDLKQCLDSKLGPFPCLQTVFAGCGCGSSQVRECTGVCQEAQHPPSIWGLRGAGQRSGRRWVSVTPFEQQMFGIFQPQHTWVKAKTHCKHQPSAICWIFTDFQLSLTHSCLNLLLIFDCFYMMISFNSVFSAICVCVCRCGVHRSYPSIPPEHLSALYERQEERAVWEAAGHEHQGGQADPGLCQEEWRLLHGGTDGAC